MPVNGVVKLCLHSSDAAPEQSSGASYSFTPEMPFRKALLYFTCMDERTIVPEEERSTCLLPYTQSSLQPPGLSYINSSPFGKNKLHPGTV